MSEESNNWEEDLERKTDFNVWMDVQQRGFKQQKEQLEELFKTVDSDFQEYLRAEKDKHRAEYQRNNPSPPSPNSSNNGRRRAPPEQEQEQEVQMLTTPCKCGRQYEFQIQQDTELRYVCPRCENTFASVNNLVKHIKKGTKSCLCDCSDE